MTLANAYDLVVFDLDGVVYIGPGPVPGAAEAISATVDGGTPVAFATNNASRGASEVADLLTSLGVPASPDQVLTSAQAAADTLADDLPPGSLVLVVGSPALRAALTDAGLTVTDEAGQRPVAVVQGYGPDVGWRDLAEACVAIRAGARWIVTNTDATLPSPRGPLPGNGSLVAALSHALGGQSPDTVVGKPEPELFRLAARRAGAARVLVVGDRLDTDMAGATRAGMDRLLVLTGVSAPVDVLRADVGSRPTHVGADCAALSIPEDQSLVPAWRGGHADAGGWRASAEDEHLLLASVTADHIGPIDRSPVAALRALASAAWAHPEWSAVRAADDAAQSVLEAYGLDAGWSLRAASAASADR